MSVQKFEEASQILQNVDVSEIVSSLALGIAEAQEKLDNNSVQQILRLSQQQIGGKSLIELGFVPAFYSFEYADVSASLNLKMGLKTNINVGLKLELDNYRQKGYRSENIDIVEKERSEEYRREFESSGEVIIQSNSEKSIKVDEQYYSMDQREECLDMIESFEDQLRTSQNVDRIFDQVISEHQVTENTSSSEFNVLDFNGFVLISMPGVSTKKWALLQIKEYPTGVGMSVNLNTTKTITFNIQETLADTLSEASTAIGANDVTVYDFEHAATDLVIYFAWDKYRKIDFSYSENGIGADSGSVYANTDMDKELRFLALVLKNDPAASVELIGHADSSGPSKYNVQLSEKRVRTVASVLLGHMGVKSSPQVTMKFPGSGEADANDVGETNSKNAKFRRVDIKIKGATDYILFIGADVNKTDIGALKNPADPGNGFIQKGGAAGSPSVVGFKYGDVTIATSGGSSSFSSLSDLASETNISDHFNMQINGETAYLLHHESRIKFTAFSESNKKINIQENIEESESEKDYRKEVEVYNSVDKEYFLQKDAEVLDNPGFIAFSGSLDARYQRQFEMSVEGSAAVSARLKAVPPPDKFLQHISPAETDSETSEG